MGAKHSRPIAAALAVACVTQLPPESHAFATPMPTKPVVTKQSRQFLYLGDEAESVPIANGVDKNKYQHPDLIMPPSSLGIDEAWAATVELEMEMNMNAVEEDFEDEHEEASVLLNVTDKVESMHRSLLEARLRMEKRAAVDSITSKPLLLNDDNDNGTNKYSVRVQIEATAQTLDAALSALDDNAKVGTSFEVETKENSIVDEEIETAFRQKEMSQAGFKNSMQSTDTRIYRAFLSLKEKRLEEALRAAEDYELMAAEALRKAQEEEKIRLARLAVIQKLTVDAVRQAEEERQLLAAKKLEAVHRSLLETRLEMERRQKSLHTATDANVFSNDITANAPAFISGQRNVEPTFSFHRALFETRLKMESKAKELTSKTEILSHMSKQNEILPHFATEVTTSKREVSNDITGSDRTKGQDSQPRRQYYFVDEIPSIAKTRGFYTDDTAEAYTGAQEQELTRADDKTFSLASFFGEALDTVGNALDSMDTTFAKWMESQSKPKDTISATISMEKSHQLGVDKVDRVSRPTFILKSAKSVERMSSLPKGVTSEYTVHANGNDSSIAEASIKRPNDTEKSTLRSIEQDERQQSRDIPNGRPTFVLQKGKGGHDPKKEEGEPQVQYKNTSKPATLSFWQHASHVNTTSSVKNILIPETSIMELKAQADTVILGSSVSHVAKFACSGGRAAFFAFGAVLEAATSEGVVSSAKAASARVAAAVESVTKSFTNATSNVEGIDGIAIGDESAHDDVAAQISAAASSVANVGSAFVRGINRSPLSNEAFDAARESTKECVSFLASLTALGIKQGERALHRFETEEDGNVSEPFILEQHVASGDISLSAVNIPNEISKCRISNGAGMNAEPTVGSTKNQGENVAKKGLEVVNFQDTQEEMYFSKVNRNSVETRDLFRSIFHS